MASAEGLAVRGLRATLGGAPVLHGVDLDVGAGEIAALLGPNGSGKTTLLRVVAGLEPAQAGSIVLGGRTLDRVPPESRGFGFVFQEAALFPGRTVEENVAYGLDLAKWPTERSERRLAEMLSALRLGPLARRRVEDLSGGERQRTALARTLAPRPRFVLLDEPFAAVDPPLRAALRAEFRDALHREGVGAIHVTHDPDEALTMADRVLLLWDGRVLQAGRPSDVFDAPVDARAARFLGYELLPDGDATLAVHPRELRIAPPGAVAGLEGIVVDRRTGGGDRTLTVQRPDGVRCLWRPAPGSELPELGERIRLTAGRPLRYPSGGAPVEPGQR